MYLDNGNAAQKVPQSAYPFQQETIIKLDKPSTFDTQTLL